MRQSRRTPRSGDSRLEPPIRLLVIEDDVRLTEALAHFLRHAGYEVAVAYDGPTGLAVAAETPPDLVILDVMFPDMDGWEICRRLRQTSDVPIIMLTARTSEDDRVKGLAMGADDYVAKPFSLKELDARIGAVLRRTHMPPPPADGIVYSDGWLLLNQNGLLALKDGRPVDLTAKERRLLFRLAEQPGRVYSARHLLTDLWGQGYDDHLGYVKLYIWRLRQKIETDPGKPRYIKTERGVGYYFDAVATPDGRRPEPGGAPASDDA